MGCCVVKNDKLTKDRSSILLDLSKLRSTNTNEIILISSSHDHTISQEFAKNFFKQSPSSSNNLGVIPEIRITPSDQIKRTETNFNRDRISREEERIGMRKQSSQNSNSDKNIIPFPRLEMTLSHSKNISLNNEKVTLTPNSLNGEVKKIGGKFIFGRSTRQARLTSSMMASLPTFLSSTSLNNKPNDYNIADETIATRQFEVTFNKEKGKFYIVDNKKGTGLFVKIQQSVIIDHDMIISFCASHMILQVEHESKKSNYVVYNASNKILKVRFLQGPHRNQEKTFNSRDTKIVRIGRSRQAEVVYKDDAVSRIQCTILFEKGNWVLYDGYLDNGNKGSTNGLWLLASMKIEIVDEMFLKTGNTGISVKLLPSPSSLR